MKLIYFTLHTQICTFLIKSKQNIDNLAGNGNQSRKKIFSKFSCRTSLTICRWWGIDSRHRVLSTANSANLGWAGPPFDPARPPSDSCGSDCGDFEPWPNSRSWSMAIANLKIEWKLKTRVALKPANSTHCFSLSRRCWRFCPAACARLWDQREWEPWTRCKAPTRDRPSRPRILALAWMAIARSLNKCFMNKMMKKIFWGGLPKFFGEMLKMKPKSMWIKWPSECSKIFPLCLRII